VSAQLGLVCECVQGTPLFFFFRLWKKKPNNQFQTVVAKERKSEREREKERRSQTEKKVSQSVSHKKLSPPLFCVCRRP